MQMPVIDARDISSVCLFVRLKIDRSDPQVCKQSIARSIEIAWKSNDTAQQPWKAISTNEKDINTPL